MRGPLEKSAGRPILLWVDIVAVCGALLMAAGATIALVHPALLASPSDDINSAVRIYAGYLVSRNGVLALGLLVFVGMRAARPLSYFLAIAGLVQLADAGLDCFEGRWIVAPGVCVLGLVFLIAAEKLSAERLWTRAYWQ